MAGFVTLDLRRVHGREILRGMVYGVVWLWFVQNLLLVCEYPNRFPLRLRHPTLSNCRSARRLLISLPTLVTPRPLTFPRHRPSMSRRSPAALANSLPSTKRIADQAAIAASLGLLSTTLSPGPTASSSTCPSTPITSTTPQHVQLAIPRQMPPVKTAVPTAWHHQPYECGLDA